MVVTLDIGSSSVRALLFDSEARQLPGFGSQVAYEIATAPDGGVEVDADELLALTQRCLSELHSQMAQAGMRTDAVACSAFWHSFLGVGADGAPTTSIIHLFDTRSTAAARGLAAKLDGAKVHARTGCVPHTSYWPAKLIWLQENRAEAFARTSRWMSFGEYLLLKLFGAANASVSMVSGSGIWNQSANDYDPEMLAALPIERTQLARVEEMDEPVSKLLPEYRTQWPLFEGIPWFPAFGDGACNNVGSGCVTSDRFSLMVGTSGAMRAVLEASAIEPPAGLWCYRLDRKRILLGGAISNGGEVFAWMKRTLALPEANQLEAALDAIAPGSHGLTLLPFFAGERSPYWRADLRAAIVGMSLATGPLEILRAALESVALRFREIYGIMSGKIGRPKEVVASGGALLHSPAWTRMMADALGRPLATCREPEASSRGAALLALERIGAIPNIGTLPADTGAVSEPASEHTAAYDRLLEKQRELYTRLFEDKANWTHP